MPLHPSSKPAYTFTEIVWACCVEKFLGRGGTMLRHVSNCGHTGECYRVIRYKFGNARSVLIVEKSCKEDEGAWHVVTLDEERQKVLARALDEKYRF